MYFVHNCSCLHIMYFVIVTTAVSYTHLDVYKRQAIFLSMFPPENHLNFIGCLIPPKELVKTGFFYSGYTDKNVYFLLQRLLRTTKQRAVRKRTANSYSRLPAFNKRARTFRLMHEIIQSVYYHLSIRTKRRNN